mmetsp:Transcript_69159/g.202987  ORF Transcript_69159/g.202987 Transcript_69159/m.202987 type:complete len:335 (+) Transcript_69159:354-1358(+)
MVSIFHSRFHMLNRARMSCWSWSHAFFSWAFIAEPLFFSLNMANLADFAATAFSISAARLSSMTTSAHVWKMVWRRPESVPDDMRLSTDLAPSFCFFMNSLSFSSASFRATSSSLSCFCISTSSLNPAKVFCFRPSVVPAFMRAKNAWPLAFAASPYAFCLLSTSAILASSSSFCLTTCVSLRSAARQSMTSLPFADSELRASTLLTLSIWAALYSKSFRFDSTISASYSARISSSRFARAVKAPQPPTMVPRSAWSLLPAMPRSMDLDFSLASPWYCASCERAPSSSFCSDMREEAACSSGEILPSVSPSQASWSDAKVFTSCPACAMAIFIR